MDCCSEQVFETHSDPALADIGKAEGVEYTVGSCRNCGALLMNCWVGGVVGADIVVSEALIDRFMAANPQERKVLLSDWFDGLS